MLRKNFKYTLQLLFCLFFICTNLLAGGFGSADSTRASVADTRSDTSVAAGGAGASTYSRRRSSSGGGAYGPGGPMHSAAAAAAALAAPGDKETDAKSDAGWRWVKKLEVQVGSQRFDFQPIHLAMLNQEKIVSDLWTQFIIAAQMAGHKHTPKGNLANAAITILYEEGASIKSRTLHLMDERGDIILFESGLSETFTALRALEAPSLGMSIDTPSFDLKTYTEVGVSLVTLNTSLQNLFARLKSTPPRYPTPDKVGEILEELNSIKDKVAMGNKKILNNFVHSEQAMRMYLLTRANTNRILSTMEIPAGSKIKGIILHVHTRADMCHRCALTLEGEIYSFNPRGHHDVNNIFSVIVDILRKSPFEISDDFRPFLLVSSRDSIGNTERTAIRQVPEGALPSPIDIYNIPISAFHTIFSGMQTHVSRETSAALVAAEAPRSAEAASTVAARVYHRRGGGGGGGGGADEASAIIEDEDDGRDIKAPPKPRRTVAGDPVKPHFATGPVLGVHNTNPLVSVSTVVSSGEPSRDSMSARTLSRTSSTGSATGSAREAVSATPRTPTRRPSTGNADKTPPHGTPPRGILRTASNHSNRSAEDEDHALDSTPSVNRTSSVASAHSHSAAAAAPAPTGAM